MALGNCYTCIKYLMFAFNFVFWLLGCSILGVGIWLRLDESAAAFLHDSSQIDFIYGVAYVLITIGFIIMLLGFLGCCGAIRESQWMLGVFFILLFVIFSILLGFGIWAAVAKDQFEEHITNFLKEGVENYYTDPTQRKTMDSIQRHFECCGYDLGADDYPKGPDMGVPESCVDGSFDKPCNEGMYKWAENRLVLIAAIAIGIAVVMIMGMAFSMILCCAIRDTLA